MFLRFEVYSFNIAPPVTRTQDRRDRLRRSASGQHDEGKNAQENQRDGARA